MSVPKRQSTKKGAWREKSLRSTFGPQCLGTVPTAPASSFGSSLRDSASKTYVSVAVDKARVRGQGGNNSPGPIYRQANGLGPQHLSTSSTAPVLGFPWAKRRDMSTKGYAPGPGAYQIKTTIGASNPTFDSTISNRPTVRFGHALRDAQQRIFISKEHDKCSTGVDSPGPNAYNVSRGVGQKSRLSNERSTQSAKIGTTPRFGVRESSARQQVLPGPGQYGNPNVLAMSHHSNLPRVGFPRANRDANKKIFISLDHEKAAYGEYSPGPGTANPGKACGKQLMSRARSAPCWSFGSGQRLPIASYDGPGPGEYYA